MKITEEFFLSSRREILEGRMFDEEEIKVILTFFSPYLEIGANPDEFIP